MLALFAFACGSAAAASCPSPTAPGTCSPMNATGRGETGISSYKAYNPFRHHQRGPCA